MDGSNDDTVEIDDNDERQLCRLADDDDDMWEDAAELFSCSTDAPVHVDVGAEDEQSTKRSRPSTSVV